MCLEGKRMLAARSSHYWLWFILFGVVSSLVVWRAQRALDTETLWLLVTGFLGVLASIGTLVRFARPYDVIVGLLFTSVGLLGLLHNMGYNVVPTDSNSIETANTVTQTAISGLSLVLPYALIHTLLGVSSLHHGLKAPAASHSPSVGAHSRAA
jgi:hypothetical protein